MCTVLQPPGVNPIAVNKYIISDHLFFSKSALFIRQLIPTYMSGLAAIILRATAKNSDKK